MPHPVQNVYTIYDCLQEESGPVFEQVNNAVAWRAYTQFLRREQQSPAEFKLLRIGVIDHSTIKATILDTPEEITRETVQAFFAKLREVDDNAQQ